METWLPKCYGVRPSAPLIGSSRKFQIVRGTGAPSVSCMPGKLRANLFEMAGMDTCSSPGLRSVRTIPSLNITAPSKGGVPPLCGLPYGWTPAFREKGRSRESAWLPWGSSMLHALQISSTLLANSAKENWSCLFLRQPPMTVRIPVCLIPSLTVSSLNHA